MARRRERPQTIVARKPDIGAELASTVPGQNGRTSQRRESTLHSIP